MQGGPANNATAGKVAQTVSLQLAPEQVKKITVAEHLGKLSLAVRSAVDQQDTADTDTSAWWFMQAISVDGEYSVRKDDSREHAALCSAPMCRRKLPARVQRWWLMQAIRLRNTQSSCRRNSDER